MAFLKRHVHRRYFGRHRWHPGSRPQLHHLVNHILLVDEVAGGFECVEQRRNIARPVVEELIGRLGRRKASHAARSVDACIDGLVADHLAQLLLRVL
eukprot:scaffold14163_cov115-Isochrysis_galbana.AAC.5